MTNLQQHIAFYEAAGLNKFHSRKRKDISRTYGQEFGSFVICDVEQKDWWYRDFIGIEFIGLIVRNLTTREIRDVYPVQITGTSIQIWNTISPKDLRLI
jgi:hypothetical protein